MTTQEISQIIADYFKTQPVLKAWLFGSFSRGEQTDSSDVDILFVPDHSGKPFTLFTHADMYLDLKELLGREVDLVVEGTLRPYAAERANQDKKLIYEREKSRSTAVNDIPILKQQAETYLTDTNWEEWDNNNM